MFYEEMIKTIRECKIAALGISSLPNVDNTTALKNLLYNIGKLEGYIVSRQTMEEIKTKK